jgi:hypothetical protein
MRIEIMLPETPSLPTATGCNAPEDIHRCYCGENILDVSVLRSSQYPSVGKLIDSDYRGTYCGNHGTEDEGDKFSET